MASQWEMMCICGQPFTHNPEDETNVIDGLAVCGDKGCTQRVQDDALHRVLAERQQQRGIPAICENVTRTFLLGM